VVVVTRPIVSEVSADVSYLDVCNCVVEMNSVHVEFCRDTLTGFFFFDFDIWYFPVGNGYHVSYTVGLRHDVPSLSIPVDDQCESTHLLALMM
jgi:hypothetical protein